MDHCRKVWGEEGIGMQKQKWLFHPMMVHRVDVITKSTYGGYVALLKPFLFTVPAPCSEAS